MFQRDATLDEITTAKMLAKVYHPDANAHKNNDTTAFMQEILGACTGFYRIRKSAANITKNIRRNRTRFQETFTLTENEEENTQVLLSHIGICLINKNYTQ